jgi:hypothetical protein
VAGDLVDDTIGLRVILPYCSKHAPISEDREFLIWRRYSSTVGKVDIFPVIVSVRIYHI